MANTQLGLYNTVTVPNASPAMIAVGPAGTWYWEITNLGTGNIFMRQGVDPSGSDPLSYTLPTGKSITLPLWGPSGIRLLTDTASTKAAIALVPRDS